jgi:hypothetical protein
LACRHGLLADQVVDDAVKNLDETLRAEEPGDTAVPEDTIDADADAAAEPAQVVRKRSSGVLARTNDVKNLTEKVTACAEKMVADLLARRWMPRLNSGPRSLSSCASQ